MRILQSNFLWTRVGGVWETEAVPLTTGAVVGCELGPSGTLHAAVNVGESFWEAGVGYLRRGADGWSFEEVDASGPETGYTVGWGADVAVAPDGTPHLLYPDRWGIGLHHAVWNGTGWSLETIVDGDAIPVISAACTAAGLVRVVYFDASTDEIWYAEQDGAGAWSTTLIDGSGLETVSDPDLALDADGHAHIAYIAAGNVVHAFFDGSAWSSETVAGGQRGTAIAVEDDGTVHLVWTVSEGAEIRHGVLKNGAWTVETVVSEAGGGLQPPAMAVDGAGFVHLDYEDSSQHAFYATNAGGGWSVEQLCTRRQAGWDPELGVTPAGVLMATSNDAPRHVGRCVRRDACGAWQAEDLDPGGAVVGATALAFDDDGAPRLALRISESGTQHVLYGVPAGSTWSWETIATDSNLASSPLLLFDPEDRPHLFWSVSASFSTPSAVRHAWNDGSGWAVEDVDDGGSDLSAAVAAGGEIHLAYRHDTELRHAVLSPGGSWSVETVGGGTSETCIGTSASLALDSAGRPWIAYFDCHPPWNPKPILVSHWDGSAWQTEEAVADIEASYWPALSLAMDSSDRPGLAWFGSFALRSGGVWQVEEFWSTTTYCSLVFGPGDDPYIAFGADGKLRLAGPAGVDADVDGDGLVDGDDMDALVGHIFGVPAPNPDLTHDCLVDARDIAALLGALPWSR